MNMVYTDLDTRLCGAVTFQFFEDEDITIWDRPIKALPPLSFQFPPKILTDNRSGTWVDPSAQGGQVATYTVTQDRHIALHVTYIIDGGNWTAAAVAKNVKLIRGYFARQRLGHRQRNLVVRFKMWLHGGDEEMTFRIHNINVKHGETIVVDNQDGKCDPKLVQSTAPVIGIAGLLAADRKQTPWKLDAFPLRTDITMDLKMWTKGGSGKQKLQDLDNLKDEEIEDWY